MTNDQFISSLRQIASERKVDVKDVLKAIEEAVLVSYIREKDIPRENLEAIIDDQNGEIKVYLLKKVVSEVIDPELEIAQPAARVIDPDCKIGDYVKFDITAEGDFGRIAAQSARQVIKQKIREAERNAVLASIQNRIGNLINVQVEKINSNGDVVCEYNGVKAILPKEERIVTEYYKVGSTIKVMLEDIVTEPNGNKYLLLARGSEKFLYCVFNLEIPEISSGTVEIMGIAREAGFRSKVAVKSNSPGVDPRGSCIGQRGTRINAILNLISSGKEEERVDIIEYKDDPKTYIANSIQPAEALSVEILDPNAKKAKVTVALDKLSLAIGKDGQNVRLAKKLTGWDIEIVGVDTTSKESEKNGSS